MRSQQRKKLPRSCPSLSRITRGPILGEAPLMLSAALCIINLSAIDETDELFRIEGYLLMSRRDDRRAQTSGAGPLIRHFEEGDIWPPPI